MIRSLVFELLLLLACIVFHSSCYTPRYVYSPSAHNVPVLLKKGDNKLAIYLSTNLSKKNDVSGDNKSRGADIQCAYAVSDKFALQAGYYGRTEKNYGDYLSGNSGSSVLNYKRHLTEFGVGYYRSLQRNKHAVFQVFAGIGFGQFGFTDAGRDPNNASYERFHRVKVTRLYLQPAFMVKVKNNFASSLSSRFSVVYFHKIRTDYSAAELDNYKLDSLDHSPRLFWEPAVINTFGFKKIPGMQFELQAGLSLLASPLFIDYRAFNFSMGIMFNLPELLKKKKHGTSG